MLKTLAPPHKEGFVKLSLSIDNEIISSHQGPDLFEFRKPKKNKNESKSPIALINKDSEAGNFFFCLNCVKKLENDYKVRVVERMREFDNQFGPIIQSGRHFQNQDTFKKYLDVNCNEITDMSSFLPETELAEILEFMNLNKPAGKEAEFRAFLDSNDRDGYSMIHYLCYLSKDYLKLLS